MSFERFDVVVVPFPFSKRAAAKRRPALVLSGHDFDSGHGHAVLAMITTARHTAWPSDTAIANLAAAGLTAPSVVRLKLFTLDGALILRRIGRLADGDAAAMTRTLHDALT